MPDTVITGVGGLIGYHLASNYLKRNHAILGIDLSTNALIEELQKSPCFDFRLADLASVEQTQKALPQPVKIIYHLASQPAVWFANSHPRADFLTNALGTINVLERMRELGGGKIIFTSTGDIYENTKYPDEQSPLKPQNFYGLSKLTAENYIKQYAQQFSLNYTIMRFSVIYGPHIRRNVIFDILKGITGGELVLHSSPDSEYDFLYIDDCIDALILAAAAEWDNKTINISSGKATPVNQLIDIISSAMAKQGEVEIKALGENVACKVYLNKQALSLGWAPKININDGIKKTVEWWISNNAN